MNRDVTESPIQGKADSDATGRSADTAEPVQSRQNGDWHSESDGNSAPDLRASPIPAESAPVERDAIVILGRRRAGKTVYLATLYSMLWQSLGKLRMKALSGSVHSMLTSIADELGCGRWPEATLSTQMLAFDLHYEGKKRLLVACDYAGEDFRRAFIEDQHDPSEVNRLLRYVDRAAAVMLLIDPAVAVEGKHEERVDDDFGMVQAVERIRNWQGGRHVPIVLLLTKSDRNAAILRSYGSAKKFVLKHYPALARTIGRLAIFPVAAVREGPGEGGAIPATRTRPMNITHPVIHCLKEIEKREEAEAKQEADEAQRAEWGRMLEYEERLRRRRRRRDVLLIALIILAALGLTALWYIYVYYY